MNGSASGPSGRVSVVIPVLNAAPYLPALFETLFTQEPLAPAEIILIDSNSSDDTVRIASGHDNVTVATIDKFSHGYARNLGAQMASGQIVVFLTQDALPAGRNWLDELLAPFGDPRVGATYSRQVPRPGASPMERFFMASHFPGGDRIRREQTGNEPLTLSSVFFSNVSSAVRRSLLMKHPFDESLIMSEDQQLSRDLLEAGHIVVYNPESVVIHSHDYTLKDVFRRYFDSVYSLTLIFSGHSVGASLSMGISYLSKEVFFMLRNHVAWLPYYALYVAAKGSGTLAGHMTAKLPLNWRRKMSFHSYHWEDS